MTVKQESYIEALLQKKQTNEEIDGRVVLMCENREAFSNAQASELIGMLLAAEDKTAEQVDTDKVNREVHYLLAHKKSAKNAAKLEAVYRAIGRRNITRMTEFTAEEAAKIAEVL